MIFDIAKREIKYQLKSIAFYVFIAVISLFAVTQFGGDIKREPIQITIDQKVVESLPSGVEKFQAVKEEIIEHLDFAVLSKRVYKYSTGIAKTYTLSESQVEKLQVLIKVSENSKDYSELEQCMTYVDELLDGGTIFVSDYVESTKNHIESKKEYIKQSKDYLEKDKITGGYARLFCDYMGFVFGLYSAFIAAYALLRDRRNNIHETIYSKSISSWSYIGGKFIALSLLMTMLLMALALFYDIKFIMNPELRGVEIMKFACLKYSIIWVVPTILFSNAIGMLTSIAFQSGTVSIGIQLILWFSSMRGLRSSFGLDKFILRFNTTRGYEVFMSNIGKFIINRVFYTVISIVLIGLCVYIFDKKRGNINGKFNIRDKFSKIQLKNISR